MPLNRSNIEWIHPDPKKRRTWNPITGCLGPAGDGKLCPYCYAEKVTERFPEHYYIEPTDHEPGVWKGFQPLYHPYRLPYPAQAKKPVGIFGGSMADMFGDWVPDEEIEKIFQAAEAAPQHTYFWLTKNPKRYMDLFDWGRSSGYKIPANWHLGYSTDGKINDGLMFLDSLNFNTYCYKLFVSIEPLLYPIKQWPTVDKPKWIIVGAQTAPLVLPKIEWVLDIRRQCKEYSIKIFEKDSLKKLNLPGGLIQEWPKGVFDGS